MADPLKKICDELGVCKEEALFYLEGFRWDLNAAMEACRSKTLPPTENERAAAEEHSRNELIAQFLALSGSSAEEANNYLSGSNWSLDLAVRTFYDHSEKKSRNHDGNTETWYPEGTDDVMQDVLSKVPQFHNASMDLRIGSPPSASTPPLELTQKIIKQFREIVPQASSQDAIYCLNQCKGDVSDAVGYFNGKYSEARPGIATAVVVKNFSGRTVDQDSTTEPLQHTPEAKPLVTSSQVEESENPIETLPLKEEGSSEVKEEHIGSFVKMTGASREDAIANLEHFKWDLNQAIKFYEEHGYSAELISALSLSLMENKDPPLPSTGSPSQSQTQLDASSVPTEKERSLQKAGDGDVTAHVKIQESSSPPHTREGTSLNQLLNSLEHDDLIDFFVSGAGEGMTRDAAIFYLTLSNWDVEKAFSYITEGEKTTQENVKDQDAEEAGEGDVTVAIPRMASSQVDGKAVEEGSSAGKVSDPFADRDRTTVETQTAPSTIMMTICLADGLGTELQFPFRSNQTVRDIRNAIDQQYPDNDRSYHLRSMDGVVYNDWNITVSRVSTGGCRVLLQRYP